MEKEEAGLRPVMLPFLRMYLSDFQYFLNKSVLFCLIETISNPQQSWGDSWTQGAINVVSN